ncbi:hypothetical protein SAMN02745945_01136 [Peptoclostridium litorale DSM 5388]|uniref:Uncharacterized protein n=1 Tax=Peptoclostridium litorale DSM 5388 TaxID=1121324 RepID=A0A069RAU3_PEPLI|nr:hypothetical protein [Peptoclostridium litorale]KDR93938.1 hypothetical protein CLIT_23c02100 [Peptoclostridium litorale DSM 5388]KDR95365.1 hypothetical protein CLIT_10c00920 [Peptoclostridium litorale DSM 5388]SIN88968.1 hypothetical protein SAMN02745945_01136 [Peptoclostridium litorale DSM 5388]
MEKEKRNAILRIAAVVAVFAVMVFLAFYSKHIALKIVFGALAVVIGAFIVRIIISLKRKKFYIQGQCIAVQAPKGKFKKYSVFVKMGKATKKLYSAGEVKMKKGKFYGIYYEEKSNDIVKYEEIKPSMNITRKK